MNVAIFASGNGTNFQRIAEYFSDNSNVNIKLMICNNPDANVINRAIALNVHYEVITKNELKNRSGVLKTLKNNNIDFIVLAGFLLLIPDFIINEYPGKIVNIHPALLPKFGGKGMYGMHVHEAVIASKTRESGITIHYVNSKYDSGQIIFQTKCSIEDGDTPGTLAAKIHMLEQEYYPQILEKLFV